MKQKTKQLVQQVFVLIVAGLITSCSQGNNFKFENPEDAIKACRTELNDLSKKEKADYKQVTEITNRWIALQDSSVKVITRFDSIRNSNITVNTYLTLADSIRNEIIRIAYSEKRSLPDIIYMMVNTTCGKSEITNSKEYKEATDFFKKIDKNPLFSDKQYTLQQYRKILSNIKKVKKEKDLMEFMEKEDQCFRSLIKFQKNIEESEIETITEETERFFDNLLFAAAKKDNDTNKRILTYLYIRINRRIIQNAEACVNDIEKNTVLSDQAKISYRWIILQPFLSMDRYLNTYLSKDQKESLIKIGKNLPKYLSYLDETKTKFSKKEKERLDKDLAASFLTMYLKQNL